MSITPPTEHAGRALFRAGVEQAVQLIPVVGGVLTTVFKVTHPSTFERDLNRWRGDVIDTLNDHETRLTALESHQQPTITLSPTALDLGIWLVRSIEGIQPSYQNLGAIASAFPSLSKGALEEAICELEELGLADVVRLIGPNGYRVRPTWPLYWLFSPMACAATPVLDALTLATIALREEDAWFNAWRLADALGWEPFRINSAMVMIVQLIPDALTSNPANPSYAVPAIYIDPAARVKLRRFIETARQAGVEAPTPGAYRRCNASE